jgi:hypothetical protein
VFDGPDDLVDESDNIPALQEKTDERVEERAEGTGTQASDVVRPPEE